MDCRLESQVKFINAAVVLLIILFSSVLYSSNSCQNYFLYEQGVSALDTPYLKAVGRYASKDGHVIYYEQLGRPNLWEESKRVDPHGFMSNMVRALGEKAAEYWGAVQLGLYFSFADVDFLNMRLSRWNQKASTTRTIPIQFRLDKTQNFQNTEKRTSANERFVTLSSQGIVIVGEAGWIRKHDENYHVASNLYIPRSIHLEAQKKSQILVDFKKFMSKRGLLSEEFQAMFELIFAERAQEIDFAGNVHIAIIYAMTRTQREGTIQEEFIQQMLSQPQLLSQYTHAGKSPYEYLRESLQKLKPEGISSMYIDRIVDIFMVGKDSLKSTTFVATEAQLAEMTYENFIYMRTLSERLWGISEPVPEPHF